MFPTWLHVLSIASVSVGIVCAVIIATDELRHPQSMGIMNLVWPITALFGTAVWLWAYFRFGRETSRNRASKSFLVSVCKAASHCGAGCTLGDIAAECLAVAFPAIAVWFGWKSLFSDRIFAVWLLAFVLAYVLGIVFQYFSVAMHKRGFLRVLWAAVKADTLSLVAWQTGMYGAMALAQFRIFPAVFGARLSADTVEFWFVMQIAMLAGFATSLPANWLLIKSGIKERM